MLSPPRAMRASSGRGRPRDIGYNASRTGRRDIPVHIDVASAKLNEVPKMLPARLLLSVYSLHLAQLARAVPAVLAARVRLQPMSRRASRNAPAAIRLGRRRSALDQ